MLSKFCSGLRPSSLSSSSPVLSSPFLILPSAFSVYGDTILHTAACPHLEAVTHGYACATIVLIRT